ncbi:unnamed protein product [Ixodes persulcatus]
MLLLSGDVETNPGPDLEKMMKELLESQKQMNDGVKDIKANQTKLQASFDEMNKRIDDIETKLGKVQKKNNKENIENLVTTVNQLQETVKLQQKALVNMEDRSRRNNLIVFGIPETEKKTSDDVRSGVLIDLFHARLGLKIETVERIHRLGKKREKFTRPIIMNFRDYNEKIRVFQNCYKLKGTNIAVQNDYWQATLSRRKMVWESTSAERSNGSRVKLFDDKIQIDNDFFVRDNNTASRTKLRDKARSPNQ